MNKRGDSHLCIKKMIPSSNAPEIKDSTQENTFNNGDHQLSLLSRRFVPSIEGRLWGEGKMTLGLINANPVVHERRERLSRADDPPHHPCSNLHPDDVLDALDVFGQFQIFLLQIRKFLPGLFGFSLIACCFDFFFPFFRYREGYKRSGASILAGAA
jgi:hypothetical protein